MADGLLEEPRRWTREDYLWVAQLTAEEEQQDEPIGQSSPSEVRYGDTVGTDLEAREAVARILARRREARLEE